MTDNSSRLNRRSLLILLFMGLLLFSPGLICLASSVILHRRIDRLEALPVLSVAALENSQVGQEGIIEGRISERNPIQTKTFVAYWREKFDHLSCSYDDEGFETCTQIWEKAEQVTPALWLDLPDGQVHLVNSDYRLGGEPAKLESTTDRYRGFEVGDVIFVRGRVVMDGEERGFQAHYIYGKDFQSYLAMRRVLPNLYFWVGVILLGLASGGIWFMNHRSGTDTPVRQTASQVPLS